MFGRTVWERELHQAGCAAGLAVTGEHVVVHERRTRLVGLDPFDGTRRWDVPFGTLPRATVIVSERCLAIPQNRPLLPCLNVRTGELLWSAQLPEHTGHLVATRDTVLVGGWRGYTPLTAFDLETGTLLWRSPECVELAASVVVEAGVLVGEPYGTEIRLIDARDGGIKSRWSLPEPLASGDTQPVLTPLDSDRVLARCGAHTVLEVSLSTGAVAVFYRSERSSELASRAVSRTGPILWVPEVRGGMMTLDAHDGRPLRNFAASGIDHPVQTDSGFVAADFRGRLALVVPDPKNPKYSTHDARITQRIRVLRDHGPRTVLVLTKGTLRVVEVDRTADP